MKKKKRNGGVWYFVGGFVIIVLILGIFLINLDKGSSMENSFNFVLRPNDFILSNAEKEYGLREDIEIIFTSESCYENFIDGRFFSLDVQQISSNPDEWVCRINDVEFFEGYLKGKGLRNFEDNEYNYINYAINCECWKK